MADSTDTRPHGLIPLAALALLTERPLHPYEMQRLLHDRHMDYAEGRTRALYRAIEELEEGGWIEPAETTREGRRPERTVYRITPEGHEALEDWLQDELERPAVEHLAFSAAVGLVAYLAEERVADALRDRVVALRAELAARDVAKAALQHELNLPRVVLLELEHERALQDAELRWVVSVIDDIRTGRLHWDEEILRTQMRDHEMARRARHPSPIHDPEPRQPSRGEPLP